MEFVSSEEQSTEDRRHWPRSKAYNLIGEKQESGCFNLGMHGCYRSWLTVMITLNVEITLNSKVYRHILSV